MMQLYNKTLHENAWINTLLVNYNAKIKNVIFFPEILFTAIIIEERVQKWLLKYTT